MNSLQAFFMRLRGLFPTWEDGRELEELSSLTSGERFGKDGMRK
jgi:hypothetical protein